MKPKNVNTKTHDGHLLFTKRNKHWECIYMISPQKKIHKDGNLEHSMILVVFSAEKQFISGAWTELVTITSFYLALFLLQTLCYNQMSSQHMVPHKKAEIIN